MTRRPYRSITSQLTDDHLAAFARAQEAELRGDWEAAASHHLSVPFFERSTHGQRLRTLAGLGDSASAWMIARHLTEVARRLPHREEHALPRAIELGVIVGHPRGIDVARIGCEHPEQVPAYLFARDWVARQADIHEGGALAENHAGLLYASMGALVSARFYADRGDRKNAKAQLQWVLERSPSPEMRDLARLRLAASAVAVAMLAVPAVANAQEEASWALVKSDADVAAATEAGIAALFPEADAGRTA